MRVNKHQNQRQIGQKCWNYQTRHFFKTMINMKRALVEKVNMQDHMDK